VTPVEQVSRFLFPPPHPSFLPNRDPPTPPFRSEASTWPSPATIPIGQPFTVPAKQVNYYSVSLPSSLPSQSRPSLPNRICPFPIVSIPSQSYPSHTSLSPDSVHVALTSHSSDWLVGGDTGRTGKSIFIFPPCPSLPPQLRRSRTPFLFGSVYVALASYDSDWPAVHIAGQTGKSISGFLPITPFPITSLPSQSYPSYTPLSLESLHVACTSLSFDWLAGCETGRTGKPISVFSPHPSLPSQSHPSCVPFSFKSVHVVLIIHGFGWPAGHDAGQTGKLVPIFVFCSACSSRIPLPLKCSRQPWFIGNSRCRQTSSCSPIFTKVVSVSTRINVIFVLELGLQLYLLPSIRG
jgi:hypothetical protein